MNAIEVRDVRKVYRRYGRRKTFGTLKSALLSGGVLKGLRPDAAFEALKGVSFDVAAGSTFGVIGANGSGKSTLLKLIAGIGKPTSGELHVKGRISALIELGAGFHPEISGRENVFINGMMLGLTKREIVKRFDEIVAFAEIEDFIDAPVKTYSSGMYMRLGFAVAINVDPDVLLVDEVLAVGDEAFTHKCVDRLAELRLRGRTVMLVTHSLDMVTRLCDAALWLDQGVARAEGDPKRVVDAYLMDVAATDDRKLLQAAAASSNRQIGMNTPLPSNAEPEDMSRASEGRWGGREAEIVEVGFYRPEGTPTHVFQSGQALEIRLKVRARQRLQDVVVGIGIFNADGVCCYGTNTQIEGARAAELVGEGEAVFHIERLDLVDGSYKIDVAVHRSDGVPYDYHRLLHSFRVTSRLKEVGVFRPPHRWTFSGGIRIAGLDSVTSEREDHGST